MPFSNDPLYVARSNLPTNSAGVSGRIDKRLPNYYDQNPMFFGKQLGPQEPEETASFTSEEPTFGVMGPDTYIPEGMEPYTPNTLEYASWAKHDAAVNQARLARAQYNDYLERFAPIEEELIGRVGDIGIFQDNAEAAAEAVDQAFDVNADEFRRGLSRYGRELGKQERHVVRRQRGLSRTAAMVQAANRARTNTQNRQMRLLGGGLSPEMPMPGRQ